jgi:hypothetical protein
MNTTDLFRPAAAIVENELSRTSVAGQLRDQLNETAGDGRLTSPPYAVTAKFGPGG